MTNKFAVINSVFDFGSTGGLARQLFEYGNSIGLEGFVFFGRGENYKEDHFIKIDSKVEFYLHKLLSLITGRQGSFSLFATRKMLKIIKANNIRHVIFLNLHGYYLNEKMLFNYCKKNKVQIVYVMPDEYAGLGKCCYCEDCKKFESECGNCPKVHGYPKSFIFDFSKQIFNAKKKAYESQKICFVGPKANLDHLNRAKLLQGKRLVELDWGIDLDVYRYRIKDELYLKYDIPKNKVLVLTVAKYSMTRKGVSDYFFGVAKKLENSKYHFINVGYDGELTEKEMPKNMTVIPYINEQIELAELYSMCDLYVLASTSDTQPLSALIALGCETPVVCFYTSGLKYISNGDSDVVKYSNEISLDSLVETISSFDKKTALVQHKCRSYAKARYSKELFNQKVFEELQIQKN